MDVGLTQSYLEGLSHTPGEQPSPPRPNRLRHQIDDNADEFSFSMSSCSACNGYYGPNFGEPVCLTCHAFLFPNHAVVFPAVEMSSEKTDDSDSGNDEPSDLNYERQFNVSQNNIPVGLPEVPNAVANNNQDEDMPDDIIPQPNDPILLNHLPNVENRLELLSTARPQDQIEPDLVQSLPPEVLLWIFRYLDDLSLCSISMVCRQWRDLLKAHVTNKSWKIYTHKRWPLYKSLVSNDDWFKIYRCLMSSCFCYTCLVQMAVQFQPLGDENSWRRNRLRSELKIMHNDPPEGIAASPLDDKYCHWQAAITGPIGSPYEGGLFYLYIQVPYSYPINPPVVRFLTKILHPNVSRHGDIGIDSIHHNWSLVLTISKVLISVQSLLTDPNTMICMEPKLGDMYMNEPKKFEQLARQWTWKYAMHDILQHEDMYRIY